MEHALKEKLYKKCADTDSGDSLQGLSVLLSLIIKSLFWHQNPKTLRVICHSNGGSHHTTEPISVTNFISFSCC